MPLYMTQFSYTKEAWAAFAKSPEDRRIGLKKLVEALGGRVIGFYYCMGDYDGVAIYEVPDNVTAMTTVLTAITPGHLKATKTTVLYTVEEAMEAMAKAGKLSFAGPKG
jgi:uncharacterized protein with GYD domain